MLQTMLAAVCPRCRMKFKFKLKDRGRTVKCLFCVRHIRLPIRVNRDGKKP
jgi:hypothetical protein